MKKIAGVLEFNDIFTTYRKQYEESTKLVKKWKRTGLLEGLEVEHEQPTVAVLLENQARQLLDEISRTGVGPGAEEWSNVALPLIRRIFAEIASKNFVSVQPLSLPSGLVFYLDFKYGTQQPQFTTGAPLHPLEDWQRDTIHGVTSTEGWGKEGLYGAGSFGYSINEYSVSGSKDSGLLTFVSASWLDVQYLPALSASAQSGSSQLQKVTVNMAGTNFDTRGVRAFAIAPTASVPGLNFTFYPAFTQLKDLDKVTFIVTSNQLDTITAGSFGYRIDYHRQPTAFARGDFEAVGDYHPDTALDIPELNIALRSEPIVAKTRKLKAVWTPEMAQDLNAYQAIDAEVELTSILSEYVSMEIDLEILDMLIQSAISKDIWSAKVGTVWNGGLTGTEADFSIQDYQQGHALAYTQQSWFQTLGTKLQRISNQIHAKTLRGGANFLVCPPEIATVIESIPGYAPDSDGNKVTFAMGVQKIGMLHQRYTVYKVPYMQENTILMGFRGAQFLETGAVYAPYIPLIMTPLVYDPVNLTPRRGVMTRYAKKVVRPEFFGKVFVTHMNYV